MNRTNTQKGAISSGALITIVIVILIIVGLGFWWYSMSNPSGTGTNATSTATSTAQDTGASGAITANTKGGKTYTNFRYGYSVDFAADVSNNISTPENVIFSFGSTTPAATLRITTSLDIAKVGYCLTVPQAATHVATTTINGTAFLSYSAASASPQTGTTTYYRALHAVPAGNACFDIEKSSQGSTTLDAKIASLLSSFSFGNF